MTKKYFGTDGIRGTVNQGNIILNLNDDNFLLSKKDGYTIN